MLDGLRVLEVATGVAGPYAGRLLAMLGATVVKVEPEGGDPARTAPVDDVPIASGATSPLYVHLGAGKRNVSADLVDPHWPHVVIDDKVAGQVAGSMFDPDRLRAEGGPKLVSLTAWGFDADDPGRMSDEMLVQAATGVLGFNRDPDGPPLRLAGWQSQYMAGAIGAVAALALQRSPVTHADVSWLGALLSGVEIVYADALHCRRRRTPPGPHPPWSFPAGAIRCADGHVAPGSIRAVDWEMQCLFYGLAELADDPEYLDRHSRATHIDEVWPKIEPWYLARAKREIFQLALDTPWAVGMVMTPLDAIADDHLEARGYLGTVETPDGPVRAPVSPVRADGLPIPGRRLAARGGDDGADDLEPASVAPRRDRHDLAGLRLIEMSVAWAGPYIGNLLAPLGVDVVKIEAQAPFDGWRALRPYDHGMPPGLEHLCHDNRWFEASGLFNSLNKGKRGCLVDLSADVGRTAFLDLVANADAVVANFTAHVLPALGLDWETLRSVNPGLVLVRMPAFGTEGPYSGAAGYGSIVEAMSGLAQRQGYEHEDARVSNLYFPDPVAGVHAVVALLAGLDQRDRTGAGTEIDLSHQEVTWLHSGEALVLADRDGRDIGRMGNREPGCATSGMWLAADGVWVAIVAVDGCDDVVARAAEMTAAELVAAVTAAGGGAEPVTDPWTAPDAARLPAFLEVVEHPVTGARQHIASPLRLDGARPPSPGPAPLFDQHTDEVFADVAGYDEDRIGALRTSGAIGGRLPSPAELGIHYDVPIEPVGRP